MSFLDLIVGRPLASSEERAEQIGAAQGIPIFGLDALGSAAYGPEAALTLLIPLGLAGVRYILPISAAIIALLIIVYFSYRQTIAAYPHESLPEASSASHCGGHSRVDRGSLVRIFSSQPARPPAPVDPPGPRQ
jgi:hypothetical protein